MMVVDVEVDRKAGGGFWGGGGWDRGWEVLLVLVLGHHGGGYHQLVLLHGILGDEDRGWNQALRSGRFGRYRESHMWGGGALDSLAECRHECFRCW